MDTIKGISKEEIKEIYNNKLKYSIIKYNMQSDGYKYEAKNAAEYMYALNVNNQDISSNMFNDVFEFLMEESSKIDKIKKANQPMIDFYVEKIIKNLSRAINEDADPVEKCARIFEYVTKTITYNEDDVNYNSRIPFGTEFMFSFYEGVPVSSTYEGMLITKTGTSNDIANLMVALGKIFGVNINTISCSYNNQVYYMNTVNINGKISYMDPVSVIQGRKEISEACLVNKKILNKNGTYHELEDKGIAFTIEMNHTYNIDKAISRERNILPDIEIDGEKIKNYQI